MIFLKPMIVLAAIALLIGCAQPPTANAPAANNSAQPAVSQQPAPAASVDVLAVGREIYLSNCAACHKEDGKGGKIEIEGKSIDPDDLTSAKIKAFADDKIYGYIFKGIEDEGMPAFEDKLTEAEIREVVRYVRMELQDMPDPNVRKPTPR